MSQGLPGDKTAASFVPAGEVPLPEELALQPEGFPTTTSRKTRPCLALPPRQGGSRWTSATSHQKNSLSWCPPAPRGNECCVLGWWRGSAPRSDGTRAAEGPQGTQARKESCLPTLPPQRTADERKGLRPPNPVPGGDAGASSGRGLLEVAPFPPAGQGDDLVTRVLPRPRQKSRSLAE